MSRQARLDLAEGVSILVLALLWALAWILGD